MVLQGGQHKPLADESVDGRSGWQLRGACVDYAPDDFFPLGGSEEAIRQTQAAKVICWTQCPVRAECDRFADKVKMEHGVWGGLSEDERKRRRRQRTRHAAASRPA